MTWYSRNTDRLTCVEISVSCFLDCRVIFSSPESKKSVLLCPRFPYLPSLWARYSWKSCLFLCTDANKGQTFVAVRETSSPPDQSDSRAQAHCSVMLYKCCLGYVIICCIMHYVH